MLTPFDFKPAHIHQADPERGKAVAKAYLIALALSPYAYHLDDPVHTIVWTVPITPEQIDHLRELGHSVNSVLPYNERWDLYHAASMLAGTTPLTNP